MQISINLISSYAKSMINWHLWSKQACGSCLTPLINSFLLKIRLLRYWKFKTAEKVLDSELDFDKRPHPFKLFEEVELPKLTKTERSIYNEYLIESKNYLPLAYYLLKNNNLSRSSKAAAKSCFINFI